MKLLIMQLPPVYCYFIFPNILISIMFSNSLDLCSFVNRRAQVSGPCKTMRQDYVVYIVNFTFLGGSHEDERLS
jgi:hypothetical protein